MKLESFSVVSKIMASESHTHTHNFPAENACGVGALSFEGNLGLVPRNGENPSGDSLLLSGSQCCETGVLPFCHALNL